MSYMPDATVSFDSASIARFRRFNRFYTRYVGTLREGLLDSSLSLAEARVLYELANREAPTAKEISSDLGLDAGYLSRILTKFESDALLKRTTSREDSRVQSLQLTRKGESVFRELNRRSDRQAAAILEQLEIAERGALLQSMGRVERLLSKAGVERRDYTLRPHRVGDMGWIVHREGLLYAQEYGWDETFEALVAQIVADFVRNYDPARERCWIAEAEGESLGHIFLVKHLDRPRVARLRLLLVEPAARGMGLGHALVAECIRFARAAGYERITLWTQSILSAAHKIYTQAGFRLVKEEAHTSFGKQLIGQTWELDLTGK